MEKCDFIARLNELVEALDKDGFLDKEEDNAFFVMGFPAMESSRISALEDRSASRRASFIAWRMMTICFTYLLRF